MMDAEEIVVTKRTCGVGYGPNWRPIPPLTKIPKGVGAERESRKIRSANQRWASMTEEEREEVRAKLRGDKVQWTAVKSDDGEDNGA